MGCRHKCQGTIQVPPILFNVLRPLACQASQLGPYLRMLDLLSGPPPHPFPLQAQRTLADHHEPTSDVSPQENLNVLQADLEIGSSFIPLLLDTVRAVCTLLSNTAPDLMADCWLWIQGHRSIEAQQ